MTTDRPKKLLEFTAPENIHFALFSDENKRGPYQVIQTDLDSGLRIARIFCKRIETAMHLIEEAF